MSDNLREALGGQGLTRSEIRDEIDEVIRNAYAEGWREAKQRPDMEPPALEIDWTQPGGVRITELPAVLRPIDRTHHAIWCAVYEAATEQGLQPSGVADKATEAVVALIGGSRDPQA